LFPKDEMARRFPGDPGRQQWSGATRPEWTGGRLAHYRVREQIGSGGMGVVVRADDTRLQRAVALKFLSPALTRDPVAKERFLKEARAASAFDHPNIATVYELGESADGQLFLVMAYYDGETLQAKLGSGPRPVQEAILLADQIAAGLSQAHQRGIVHRDIKPSNLMITVGGIVKILDFGIAKLAGQEGLTREGIVVGTLNYMSPEQARGGEVDQRTDIWSLGVVLYTMLAGRQPFRGENDRLLVQAILHQPPEPLRSVRQEIPAELERLVERMLAKDPARRPGTMEEVRASLEFSKGSREIPQDRIETRLVHRRGRAAARAAAAILAAGLAACALAFALWPMHGHRGVA
jgi:eukaryotic-like serine/threonine-protein kinase